MSLYLGENLVANSISVPYNWAGTRAEYEALTTIDPQWVYYITDDQPAPTEIYSKTEVDALINSSTYHPPLLSSIWSDHLINNQSWLRADTFSWQNGTTYSTAYNHLVSDISGITAETETIGSYTVTFYRATDGHKICLADQETTVSNIFSATGIAWYYILDTTNTRFKLPRTKFGFNGLRSSVGNYIAESLPNITSGSTTIFNGCGGTSTVSSGAFTYTKTSITSASGTGMSYGGVTFNASRSSSTYQDNAPVQERATQMYLYFYVGEYTQTAIEQTAGLNSELFNGKADVSTVNTLSTNLTTVTNRVYLKTSYVSGTSGYNIWSNGYCEQWGRASHSSGGGYASVTFLKTFANTNYDISSFPYGEARGTGSGYFVISVSSPTTTSITLQWDCDTDPSAVSWRACGYLASGQY